VLCQLCRKPFPEDLVHAALTVAGRPVMCCPICEVSQCGGVDGMRFRRAVLWIQSERKRMEAAVMRHVALHP
jgi:hypothetical protein